MDRATYEQLDRMEHKQNLILEGLQHLLNFENDKDETENADSGISKEDEDMINNYNYKQNK